MSGLANDPYFVASEPAPADARRLLLISYHFPPSTAVGALRWLKMCGHAVARGWAFDVIAADPASLKQRDETLLAELPRGTRVFGIRPSQYPLDTLWTRLTAQWRMRRSRTQPGPTRGQAARPTSVSRSEVRWFPPTPRRLRHLYNTWATHSAERAWARQAQSIGLGLVAQSGTVKRHVAIITCGPPHMVHTAGSQIAQRAGIPHVVDLRDLWSLVERLPSSSVSSLWFLLADRNERRVIDRAALVVANTPSAGAALRARYPQHSERVAVVMNGYDESEAPGTRVQRRRFIVSYAGSIYMDRDPRILFKATANLIERRRLSPQQFGLEFIGNVRAYEGIPLQQIAREEGIAEYLDVRQAMPRRQLMKHLSSASMLVILPQDSAMAVPAKAFEYMLYDAWLLVLAERDSATGQLFSGLDADVVDPSDLQGITTILQRRYEAYAAGVRPVPLAADGRYSRSRQAEILLSRLESVVAAQAAAVATPVSG